MPLPLLLPALLCLQPTPHPLACAVPSQGLGRLVQGQQVTRTFQLENRSSHPVRIREVQSRCPHTTAPLPTDPIPPGGRLPLAVTFDSSTFEGLVAKTVAVFAEGVPQPLLLEVRAHVQRPYRVEPETLRFGTVSRNARLGLALRLTSATGELPPAVAAMVEGETAFALETFALREEKAREILLTLKPGTPPRAVKATLVLTLDDAPQTRLEVPVSGELTEDVACVPSVLELGTVARGGLSGRRLQILVHHPDVEVTAVQADAPWLEASLAPRARLDAPGAKPLSPARGFAAAFRISPSAPAGSHHLALTVETTSPSQPRLKVPVTVNVE